MPLLSQNKILYPLTETQRKAVEATDGPVLVIAGAGSGKTLTLTHRLAYLIAKGIPYSRIVALTFTNKAAEEMRSRVQSILGRKCQLPFAGTFHSFCAKILRKSGKAIGIPNNFSILDKEESLEVMKEACKKLNIDSSLISPKALVDIISYLKNEGVVVEDIASYIPRKNLQEAIILAWNEYERMLKESNSVDFDNLISHTLSLFQEHPKILKEYQENISHILVDEYQDTNRQQHLLIKLLAGSSGNIFVVGDDWQAIYSFRGSDFRNILRFQHDWPNAKVFFLEENFRSTKTIVEAANYLISKNKYRTEKRLFTRNPEGMPISIVRLKDDQEEAEYVISKVKEYISSGRSIAEIAILFRTHFQSRLIEEACLKEGIPYRLIGGFKFYRRKEIKDIIAYLRYIVNPNDRISLMRIVNVPPRGIGKKTLEKFKGEKLENFLEMIEKARKISRNKPLSYLIKWLIEEIDYKNFLNPDTKEGRMRWENVEELVNAAASFDIFGKDGLIQFLANAALVQDEDEYNLEDERLTLMTIHAAKGLEFPIVFVIGCEEGILPHASTMLDENALEEERRLAYVAITRAKYELHLTCASCRMRYGEFEMNPRSRFLNDIPEQFVINIDQLMLNNLEPDINLDETSS